MNKCIKRIAEIIEKNWLDNNHMIKKENKRQANILWVHDVIMYNLPAIKRVKRDKMEIE